MPTLTVKGRKVHQRCYNCIEARMEMNGHIKCAITQSYHPVDHICLMYRFSWGRYTTIELPEIERMERKEACHEGPHL